MFQSHSGGGVRCAGREDIDFRGGNDEEWQGYVEHGCDSFWQRGPGTGGQGRLLVRAGRRAAWTSRMAAEKWGAATGSDPPLDGRNPRPRSGGGEGERQSIHRYPFPSISRESPTANPPGMGKAACVLQSMVGPEGVRTGYDLRF